MNRSFSVASFWGRAPGRRASLACSGSIKTCLAPSSSPPISSRLTPPRRLGSTNFTKARERARLLLSHPKQRTSYAGTPFAAPCLLAQGTRRVPLTSSSRRRHRRHPPHRPPAKPHPLHSPPDTHNTGWVPSAAAQVVAGPVRPVVTRMQRMVRGITH